MPRVSVIIPNYNCEPYLERCLGSVSEQTFKDFECIVVDNGSTDGSLGTLRRLQDSYPWLTVMTQDHSGPGVARNTGLSHASGEYVYFFDADDFIEPTLLEKAVEKCDRLSLDIVIWDTWFFNDELQCDTYPPVGVLNFHEFVAPGEEQDAVFSGKDNPRALFTSFQNWPWNKLFRKSFLEEHDLQFPAMYRTEDLPFACMALASAGRLSVIYERLSHYRMARPNSAMGNKDSHPLDFLEAFLLLRHQLEQSGLYETYEPSYIQWTLLGCLSNLETLKTPQAFGLVYRTLKEDGFKALGLLDVNRSIAGDAWLWDEVDFISRHLSSEYPFHRMGSLLSVADRARGERDLAYGARDRAERERDEAYAHAEEAAHNAADAVRDADRRVEEARRQVSAANDELARLKRSMEYRSGSVLCKLPRAVQRLVKRS